MVNYETRGVIELIEVSLNFNQPASLVSKRTKISWKSWQPSSSTVLAYIWAVVCRILYRVLFSSCSSI